MKVQCSSRKLSNSAMTSLTTKSTDEALESLKEQVLDAVVPSFCYGTVPLEKNESRLFYLAKGDETR